MENIDTLIFEETYGDEIELLPKVNKHKSTDNEVKLMNTLFKNKEGVNAILADMKDAFLVGLLFVLFSQEQIDEVIQRFFPSTLNSRYMLLGIKTISIVILFWIIKNWYLCRN
jgi:hypothetical protein